MNRFTLRPVPFIFVCAWMLVGNSPASGQALQVLEIVDAHSQDAVLRMDIQGLVPGEDFTVAVAPDGSSRNFIACKTSAIHGVFCLDDTIVRRWLAGDDTGPVVAVLDCDDLGLKKCTGMTVDLSGRIWVTGQVKGTKHEVYSAIPKSTNPQEPPCPNGGILTLEYCASLHATGRPLLVDLTSIDGEDAAIFDPPGTLTDGCGVLGVEEKKTLVFIPCDPDEDPIVIASGGKTLKLQGNEQVQRAALLQFPNADPVDSYIVYTTTKGRVLQIDVADTSSVVEFFDIVDERVVSCATEDFGVRASSKSGLVFLTDSACKEMKVVDANTPGLVLTLSTENTEPGGTGFATLSPTVSPGIPLDLNDFVSSNPLIIEDGDAVVTMSGVNVISGDSDMVLFQILGIPDCRWITGPAIPDECSLPGVIVEGDPAGDPDLQVLNVTPLLPAGVVQSAGDLPPLLIPNWFRGQENNGFFFDALFGLTNATIADVFEIVFLFDDDQDCVTGGLPDTVPDDMLVTQLRMWDVAVKVSEEFVGINNEHAAKLINTGCTNSHVTDAERWSLLPYNLEVAPNGGNAKDPLSGVDDDVEDDAVFAKLLVSLWDDLEKARSELVCEPVGGSALLSTSTCATLAATWSNGEDKLDKCIVATTQPKDSAGAQNCQSFVTKMESYRDTLAMATPSGAPDPANYIGALNVRVSVIEFVYHERFVHSIPMDGFAEY